MVQIYPDNLEARRRLADFYERLGDRQSLVSWREVVRLEPQNPGNSYGLAGAALRLGDLGTTRSVLQQLQHSGHTGPEYYRLSAGLALSMRDEPALEASLAELARLQPADLRTQLNLAIARLKNPDASREEAGRAALIQLAQSDQLRIRAIVELFNDVSRRWPKPTPERGAFFQYLVLTLAPAKGPRLDPPEVGDPVERLIGYAMLQPAPEPPDVVALLNWMAANGRAAAAFEWIDTLAPKTRSSPAVMASSAEAALRVGEWHLLRRLLTAGAWGAIPRDAVDHAVNFRESQGRDPLHVDRGEWTKALEAGQTSLAGLRILLRLCEDWGLPGERRQVLQSVTRNFPAETWAWRQLVSYAVAHGDSDQLWQVYQSWSRSLPGDTTVQIESAIMGLLLQRRGVPARSVTAELVRQQPGNPAAVVAQALALWRGNQLAEALAQLDLLPRTAFAEPQFALAYGLMLSEAGRIPESDAMLGRISAERLLPEERALVEQAVARNRAKRS